MEVNPQALTSGRSELESVRVEPLTSEELERFHQAGCLFPIRVLSDKQVAELRDALDDHICGRIPSTAYELTDPIRIKRVKGSHSKTTFEYEEGEPSQPRTFPFLFNLWKLDVRFRQVAFDPVIAGFARQLLGSRQVVLLEDNVVIKNPLTGTLPWHQDYSYWPLKSPAAVTVWIALDRITTANGAMQVALGSQTMGERLPVGFGDAISLMREDRPSVPDISQDPASEGHRIVTYDLQLGECGFHHAMVWHSSTSNTSANVRRAFILRYVAAGTIWLGRERFPYDEVGVGVGDPIGGPHFPVIPTAF